MLKRLISGLVGIGLWLGICFGGPLAFALGVTVLAAVSAGEWVRTYRRVNALDAPPIGEPQPNPLLVALNPFFTWLGVALPLAAHFVIVKRETPLPQSVETVGDLLPALLVGLFVISVSRAEKTGRALGGLRNAYGLVGFGYIGVLFASCVLLHGLPGTLRVAPFGVADRGAWLMMLVALCVWATDTFAYFVGKSLGKRKLAPKLSPAKTVEGSLGGFLGATLTGAAFAAWIHLPLLHGLMLGAMVGIVGQIGDLFESALKRELGVKDFGSVMPGHGGALDRFDSLLFAAPLAYLYLRLVALL